MDAEDFACLITYLVNKNVLTYLKVHTLSAKSLGLSTQGGGGPLNVHVDENKAISEVIIRNKTKN